MTLSKPHKGELSGCNLLKDKCYDQGYCDGHSLPSARQDDVAAFMEGLGATYNRDGSYYKDGRAIDDKEAQFWYTTLQQSNRQLLKEVDAAGPVNTYDDCSRCTHGGCAKHAAYLVQTETNELWHQAIQAIKERRGL